MPEPLTLKAAMALAVAAQPPLQAAEARLAQARARLAQEEATDDVDLRLDATAAWLEPPEVLKEAGREDHRLELVATTTLYDFGRTHWSRRGAQAAVEARQHSLLAAHDRQRLDVLAAYFDVVLADLAFNRENEAMSVAFINYDRAQERRELGQMSDIEVAEAHADYQSQRRRRYASEAEQRRSRAHLARLLGFPDDLPSTVVPPELTFEHLTGEVETLQARVSEANPRLRALRLEVAQVEAQLSAVRARRRPSLAAELRAGEYQRETGSTNPWRAAVTLSVPLYQGGRVSSDLASLEARRNLRRADLVDAERQLNQEVLDLWLRLDTLRIEREERQAHADYRELYLDRARAIYDLEVKTDLGDAMVRLTEAVLAQRRAQYETILGLARLAALQGQSIEDVLR